MAQKLERSAEAPDQAWQHTLGLSALLEAAKGLPPRDPFALPDLDEEPRTGLGALLVEARRWKADQPLGGQ